MLIATAAAVVVAAAAEAPGYTEHLSSFCAGISCTVNAEQDCSGAFKMTSNVTQEACEALCEEANCACFDWRKSGVPHPAGDQPDCRLTNISSDVRKSGYGYTAWVSTAPHPTPPPPPPPPPADAGINYACRPGWNHFAFCNTSLDLEARLDALVAELTGPEKASQLQARSCPPIERLGIPFFCWGQNAVVGLGPAAFPIAPAMAATFNMSAVTRLAQAVAVNGRSGFNHRTSNHSSGYSCPGSIVTWGPTMNIQRDPRWGRNFETPSEDPFLTGSYAAAWSRGATNGEDPRFKKMIVTVKHFAAYSVDRYSGPDQPGPGQGGSDRYTFNAIVDSYNLADTYFPPFKMAVVDGGARGVMCSYNEVNGVPACMSPLLRDKLRGDWGFTGYVTSDTDAISTANNHHNYYNTTLQAVTYGLRDGRCDVESSVGSTNWYATYIADFLANGTLDVALVDTAIKDTFRVRFEAGLFDPMDGQHYATIGGSDAASDDVAEASRDAIVLLQNNDRVLPLLPGKHKLVVVGPFSSSIASELDKLNGGLQSVAVNGCSVDGSDTSGIAAAITATKDADVVVLAVGSSSSVEHEYHDRSNTSLPGVQEDLVAAVLGAMPEEARSVAVISNRGALSVDTIKTDATAALLAWETGETGGPIAKAAAEAIFGVYSPGGRLPYTVYPTSYISNINFFEMSMTKAPGRSYKYYTGEALWPFGWGLSYANFTLSLASANSTTVPLELTLSVTNAGQIDGDEVLQAFWIPGWTRSSSPVPIKQLFGFTRVHLDAGETTTWSVVVTGDDLMSVNADGNKTLTKGSYTIEITNGNVNSVSHPVHVE